MTTLAPPKPILAERVSPRPDTDVRDTGPNVSEPDAGVTLPQSAHSLDGFRDWVRGGGVPDGYEAAYWDGQVWLAMTNERLKSHILPKTKITAALVRWFDERDIGLTATDGPLLVNEDADLSCGPDAVGVLWSTLESGRVTLGKPIKDGADGVELVGSPDVVVEIISPTSVDKDTRILTDKYFRAGVTEYWIINVLGEVPTLQIFVRGEQGFQDAEEIDGWQSSSVVGRQVRMTVREQRLGFTSTVFEDREA